MGQRDKDERKMSERWVEREQAMGKKEREKGKRNEKAEERKPCGLANGRLRVCNGVCAQTHPHLDKPAAAVEPPRRRPRHQRRRLRRPAVAAVAACDCRGCFRRWRGGRYSVGRNCGAAEASGR